MVKNCFNRFAAIVLAFAMCFGALSSSVGIFVNAIGEKTSTSEKPEFNYVALGASNVNGYGIHGYNFEFVYETPFEKVKDNRYGYEMDTPGAYADIIRQKLSANYNVNLHQIAMSSLRAEELHFLLDYTYQGDSYTDTWLYDTNGDGVSANWYFGAAMYEWQQCVDKNLEGFDHDPTPEELLYNLRTACREKVANADLVTIDIGMNNFGTYMINLLQDGTFTNDLSSVAPEIAEYYEIASEYVIKVIEEKMGETVMPISMLETFVDTLTYALVGYCINFDETVKEVYLLNPDVDVVVVSIQNMLKDFEIVFPGSDITVPFGEIFGMIINAANLYISVLSPYASSYSYANVSSEGHVEFFMDEIGAYNGDPSSLNVNMKDCFDTYDGSLYLKTRVQQMFAVEMKERGLVNLHESQADTSNITSIEAFHYGFHYGIDGKGDIPVVTWKDGTPLKDFLKKGEAGQLSGEDKSAYDIYARMLSVAYDVAAEVLGEAAKTNILDFTQLGVGAYLGISSEKILLEELNVAIGEAVDNPNYSYDINELYPDGYFVTLARVYGVQPIVLETTFSLAMKIQFGGTVFAHPNAVGYEYISEIVWDAYKNDIQGTDIIDSYMSVDYLPTDSSYYVAVNGTKGGYADIFANHIGLKNNQVDYTSLDNLDYSKIDMADLISIGYNDADMINFMSNQMFGYVADYIDNDARNLVNQYISSVVDKLDSSTPAYIQLGSLKDKFKQPLNGAIDEILLMDPIANKSKQELDWSLLLDEEQLPWVEFVRNQLKEIVIESIGFEYYSLEIDVVELIAENISSISTNQIITTLLGDPTWLRSRLGDDAVLKVDIPVVDAMAFALESYLYRYMECTIKSVELISYINTNHPETKIIILGHFNPLKNTYLEIGENKLDVGYFFEALTLTSTARMFVYFAMSDNSAFVHIPDATTVYWDMNNGEATNILDLFMEYNSNLSILDIGESGNKYIADRILNYVRIACEHRFENCEDTVCCICGEEITPREHTYGAWEGVCDENGNYLGETKRTCSVCNHVEKKADPDVNPPINPENPSPVLWIVSVSVGVLALVGFCTYYFVFRKKKQ